ncbi:MAG: hypothetical protein AAGF20_08490 [Pseudomonadota bacterium]
MSTRVASLLRGLQERWTASRFPIRFAVGGSLVAAIGLAGLTPNVFLNLTVAWPYAALIAAVGWGRSGLGIAPILALLIFGFAQDVTASAPLGCHGLINLLTYGAVAGLAYAFQFERSPALAFAEPLVMLAFGMALVWVMASLVSGHLEKAAPLMSSGFATIFLYMLIGPLFDLGRRRGQDDDLGSVV